MKAVFISDAHIRDHADPNLPPLLAFLQTLHGRLDRLYVVGDLFDTWFGFPHAVFDEYVPVLGALDALARSGVRIVYVTGNHDFEMGGFFEKILRAEIHDTDCELNEDGRRAYVAHGDMANPHDRKYRRLRKLLRNRAVGWLGRRLPPSWVWRIAGRMSESFTGDEIARRMSLRAVFAEHAAQKHRQGFDTVILGHLHEPIFDQKAGATYVNLGDWQRWRSFLRWEEGRLSLNQWSWPEGKELPAATL